MSTDVEALRAGQKNPLKRRAPAAGISLADLTAALAPLTGGVLDMQKCMTDMEPQFAPTVDKTLDMIQALNDRQRDQGLKLQQIQETMEPHLDDEQGDGPRMPALIFGGWSTDLDEEEVLGKARKLVADLLLDIDLGKAFMPGKQKEFLIVPLQPRTGEDRAKLQRRAIASVQINQKGRPPYQRHRQIRKTSQASA